MRKNLVLFALMAVFSSSFIACSNDEEAETNYAVNLNTPANAEKAMLYELPVALPAVSGSIYQLKSFEITESSKIVVEVRDSETQRPHYVMGDVRQDGDIYYLSGDKLNGTIKIASSNVRTTRGSNSSLEFNITIMLGEMVSYITENGTTIEATVTNTINIDEEVMNNLSRTWNILGVIVDIKGENIKAYEEFDSHHGVFDLKDVLDEAALQGVNFSDDDRKSLNRKVKSVTVTKSQKFIVSYVDGGEDVAEWLWADNNKTRLKINLKDQDMGNKFLTNETKLQIAFRDDRCNIRLETKITDNNGKLWEGSLTLKLQSAD